MNRAWQLPGRLEGHGLVLGGVLAVPGLHRAVRLFDSTRERLRSRGSPLAGDWFPAIAGRVPTGPSGGRSLIAHFRIL
ncbi:hypothetical protein H0Z60_00610 [Ectothiorhodospiraceae bacterium WFHF3C12]|nr:hypothetical protein [Ectothiorhodospiraceae bacterium WFHF3C12]